MYVLYYALYLSNVAHHNLHVIALMCPAISMQISELGVCAEPSAAHMQHSAVRLDLMLASRHTCCLLIPHSS